MPIWERLTALQLVAMSIAVSAIVKPSRTLNAMTLVMASLASTAGMLIGLGAIGELEFPLRLLIAASIPILSFFGFYHGMQSRKPIQLDITGIGQIRITELPFDDSSCRESKRTHVRLYPEEVRLLPESTLWPLMLLLRFEDVKGRRTTVAVLPDSVSDDGFRAMAVACRWIAANKVRSKANH